MRMVHGVNIQAHTGIHQQRKHLMAIWENFLWHVDNGTSFGFGVEDIKQDSRWDATLYEFPDTYADGSSLRYTVTKACKKYVDISRKFILTLSQEDATTRGTQSVMVSYRKGLPDITVPEQKYKASFYDDNYNDRLLLSDIVQINKFKGYMLKEKEMKSVWEVY